MHRTTIAICTFLALAACGGGGGNDTGSAGGSLDLVTISGRVVTDQRFGVIGAFVAINDIQTKTDSDGYFEVEGVSLPYTAVLHRVPTHVTVFEGMTRLDPTFEVRMTHEGTSHSVAIAGTVSGGVGFPQPANYVTATYRQTDGEAGGMSGIGLSGSSDSFSFSASWRGPPRVGHVRALQYLRDPATNMPVIFTGFGEQALPLADSDFTGFNVAMQAVSNQLVSGATSLPDGLSISSVAVLLRHGDLRPHEIYKDLNPTTIFSYLIPGVPGADVELRVNGFGPAGAATGYIRVPSGGASGQVVFLPDPAQLVSPVQNAVGVDHTTPLVADAFEGRLYKFTIDPDTSGLSEIELYTANPSTTIPDLAMHGAPLHPNEQYRISVETLGPFQNIDDAAGPGGLTQGASARVFSTLVFGWDVTTAP